MHQGERERQERVRGKGSEGEVVVGVLGALYSRDEKHTW